jgi:zinc metalloprotease ZmpB
MLRAIIVNVGTVAGVSAALLYQPQVDVLEFAGGTLSSGSDTSMEQTQEPNQPNTPQPDETNNKQNNNSSTSNPTEPKKKNKNKNNNGGSPSPSSSSNSPSPSSSNTPEPTKSATPTPTPTPTKTKTPTPTPTPTPTSSGKDGTYNGSRVDVFYVDGGTKRQSGSLKIQVIIKDGKVSDILWTEYPTGDHQKYTNRAYSSSAKPLIGLTVAELKSAKVATKTGATGTSTAFVTSLEAVLQQL